MAALDAKKIIQRMRRGGELPDDPMAVEALEVAAQTLRQTGGQKDKIATARLILDFTTPKPTQRAEATVRTHEDFLDSLMDH